MHTDQAATRDNALPADMFIFPCQATQQRHVQFGLWAEVRVSTFAGKGMILLTIKIQPGLAKTGTGRDNGGITGSFISTLLQGVKISSFQGVQAPCRSLKIVQ